MILQEAVKSPKYKIVTTNSIFQNTLQTKETVTFFFFLAQRFLPLSFSIPACVISVCLEGYYYPVYTEEATFQSGVVICQSSWRWWLEELSSATRSEFKRDSHFSSPHCLTVCVLLQNFEHAKFYHLQPILEKLNKGMFHCRRVSELLFPEGK